MLRTQYQYPPEITIRRSGDLSVCFITEAVTGDSKFIEIELNEQAKEILVKPSNDWIRMTRGMFALDSVLAKKVLKKNETGKAFPLKERADGWWYGSYA